MRTGVISATIAAFTASFASAAVPRAYVTSVEAGFQISPDYAAVSTNPLYKGSGLSGENPLFEGTGTSRISITISGHSAVGSPAASPDGGIYSQFGAASGGGFTGTLPGMYAVNASSSSGKRFGGDDAALHREASLPAATGKGVIFKSLANNRTVLVTGSSSGAITGTLPTEWNLTSVNGVAASTKADAICATGVHSGIADGSTNQWPCLFVGSSAGLSQVITLTGNNFSSPVASSSMFAAVATNASGDASVIMTAREAGSGIATGRRQYQPLIVRKRITLAADQDSPTLAVCDTDSIVLLSQSSSVWDDLDDDGGAVSNPLALGTPPTPLISVNDPLGGSTVAALSLSPQSFYGGELFFHALLANGSSGIFAIAVPEPVTIGALAAALPMLLRRRR